MTSKLNKAKQKLEFLRNRKISSANTPKTKEERQKFWSEVMENAPSDKDRLRASELLGKSEGDFSETTKHEFENIAPKWQVTFVKPGELPEEDTIDVEDKRIIN